VALTHGNSVGHDDVGEQSRVGKGSGDGLEKLRERGFWKLGDKVGKVQCDNGDKVGDEEENGKAGCAHAPDAGREEEGEEQGDFGGVEAVGNALPLGGCFVVYGEVTGEGCRGVRIKTSRRRLGEMEREAGVQ
jgi:hypothetical protein